MRREEKTGEAKRKGEEAPGRQGGWLGASLGQRPGVAAHDWQGRRGVRGPRCSRIKEAPGLGAGGSAIGERRGRGRGRRGSEPCRAAASESGEREGGGVRLRGAIGRATHSAERGPAACARGTAQGGRGMRGKVREKRFRAWKRRPDRHCRRPLGGKFFRPRWKYRGIFVDNIL